MLECLTLWNMQKIVKPNEEVIEDKGVKVLIDPKAIIYLLGTEMDYKKENYHHILFLIIQMKLKDVVVESLLRFNLSTIIHLKLNRMRSMFKFINFLKF